MSLEFQNECNQAHRNRASKSLVRFRVEIVGMDRMIQAEFRMKFGFSTVRGVQRSTRGYKSFFCDFYTPLGAHTGKFVRETIRLQPYSVCQSEIYTFRVSNFWCNLSKFTLGNCCIALVSHTVEIRREFFHKHEVPRYCETSGCNNESE